MKLLLAPKASFAETGELDLVVDGYPDVRVFRLR